MASKRGSVLHAASVAFFASHILLSLRFALFAIWHTYEHEFAAFVHINRKSSEKNGQFGPT